MLLWSCQLVDYWVSQEETFPPLGSMKKFLRGPCTRKEFREVESHTGTFAARYLVQKIRKTFFGFLPCFIGTDHDTNYSGNRFF